MFLNQIQQQTIVPKLCILETKFYLKGNPLHLLVLPVGKQDDSMVKSAGFANPEDLGSHLGYGGPPVGAPHNFCTYCFNKPQA